MYAVAAPISDGGRLRARRFALDQTVRSDSIDSSGPTVRGKRQSHDFNKYLQMTLPVERVFRSAKIAA